MAGSGKRSSGAKRATQTAAQRRVMNEAVNKVSALRSAKNPPKQTLRTRLAAAEAKAASPSGTAEDRRTVDALYKVLKRGGR